MHRMREPEHPDDIGVQLAEPVIPHQLTELRRLGYRGLSPSTSDQADAILRQLSAPADAPR